MLCCFTHMPKVLVDMQNGSKQLPTTTATSNDVRARPRAFENLTCMHKAQLHTQYTFKTVKNHASHKQPCTYSSLAGKTMVLAFENSSPTSENFSAFAKTAVATTTSQHVSRILRCTKKNFQRLLKTPALYQKTSRHGQSHDDIRIAQLEQLRSTTFHTSGRTSSLLCGSLLRALTVAIHGGEFPPPCMLTPLARLQILASGATTSPLRAIPAI